MGASIFLVSDVHFGKSNASEIFEHELQKFLDEVFFPEIEMYPDKQRAVVIAGDLMDNRRSINVKTLARVSSFFERLDDMYIPVFVILGNHDIFYRDVLHPNSIDAIVRGYRNVVVVDKPQDVTFTYEGKITLVPWICKENYTECINAIKETDADVVVGHFEMNGFEFSPGRTAKTDFNLSMFRHVPLVFSGHYHLRTKQQNFQYLGSPYQQDRGEAAQIKGFMRLELKKGKKPVYELIKNPSVLYVVLHMKNGKIEDGVPNCTKKIVDLIVDSKSSQSTIDAAVAKIEAQGPWTVNVQLPSTEIESAEANDVFTHKQLNFTEYVHDYLSGLDLDIEEIELAKNCFDACKDV